MKKIIQIFVSGLILLISISVRAERIENVTVVNDSNSDGIIVSGNLDTSKTNIPLILTVSYNGKILSVAQDIARTVKDGKTVFQFETLNFADDVDSGKYEFCVSGQYIDKAYTVNKDNVPYYVSTRDSVEALKTLNTAVDEKNISKIAQVFSDFEKELGINSSKMSKLTDAGKNILYKLISESRFDFDESNLKTVTKAKLAFRDKYGRASAVAEYYDISGADSLKAWNTLYGSKYVPENSKLYKYYNLYKNEISAVVEALNKERTEQFGTLLDEEKHLEDLLIEAVLLYNIYKEPGAVVRNIYNEFSEIFTPNKTYYNNLSEQKKGELFIEISGKLYADSEESDSEFYEKSKSLSGEAPSGSSGGRKDTWGGDTVKTVVNVPVTASETNKINEFSDIDSVPWAKEAIKALFDKKVLSGKGSGMFMPNDKVTRAEFIKMLVLAAEYELPTDYEQRFEDVNINSWYWQYIEAARNAKLITGDENSNFRPESEISREDVCVILARYLKYDGGMGINAPFSDIDQISDYALEPVVYLYQKKIISGNDTGSFMPKAGTKRAEAAKMIYGMLIQEGIK